MANLVFKRGSINYSDELQEAILVFAQRLARVMDRLDEQDARIVAFALEPTLDRYLLGAWSKRDIIQEAIESMIRNNFNPKALDVDTEENIYDMADSINSGIY